MPRRPPRVLVAASTVLLAAVVGLWAELRVLALHHVGRGYRAVGTLVDCRGTVYVLFRALLGAVPPRASDEA